MQLTPANNYAGASLKAAALPCAAGLLSVCVALNNAEPDIDMYGRFNTILILSIASSRKFLIEPALLILFLTAS